MANATPFAYEDLRNYIVANWRYIELRDSLGNPFVRLSTSDTRVSWTHEAGSQILELTVTIQGSNSDITLPSTFAQSAIFKDATSTDAVSIESFPAFTMEGVGDELTIKHRIEVPRV